MIRLHRKIEKGMVKKLKRSYIFLSLAFILILCVAFLLNPFKKNKPVEAARPAIPYSISGAKILVGQNTDGITANLFRQKIPRYSTITAIEAEEPCKNYISVNGMLLTKDGKELIACPPGFSGKCTVPAGVSVIQEGAFQGCSGITEINLPDSLSSIGADAFSDCRFTEITLPLKVSSIGENAFANNANLQQITIPQNGEHLDESILSGCKDPVICGDPGSEAQKLAEARNLIFQPSGADSVLPIKPAANAPDKMKLEYKVSVILARLRPDMSDVEKVKAVNQYMAENITYDMKDYLAGKMPYRTQTIIGALVDGQTTCSGYTAAFHLLMQRLGISDALVSSIPMNHSWNMVKLDGSWYHVDVTWDRKGLYDNFLKSDAAMLKAGWASDTGRVGHYDWTSEYKATNTKYDRFDWYHSTPETINRGLTVIPAAIEPSQTQIMGKTGSQASLSAVSNLGETLTAKSSKEEIAKISETSESDGKTSWKINLLQKGAAVIHVRSSCNAVSDVKITAF